MRWPLWEELVASSIHSSDHSEHWHATTAAATLGLDVWPILFQQLQANPLQEGLYYDLMRTTDIDRIREVVDFAEQNLPLAEIASGAKNAMGFGKEFAAHRCLDSMLQDLEHFEGVGGQLILAALRSPVVRNRYLALRALAGWGSLFWPEGSLQEIQRMSERDPDDDVKDQARTMR